MEPPSPLASSWTSPTPREFMVKLLVEDGIHGKMLKIVGTIHGLDGLAVDAKYFETSTRFSKWRVVLKIGSNESSQLAINENALSLYAIICQENGLVPIVELEILVDGSHDISKCASVTKCVLAILVVNKLRGVLKISTLKIRVPHTLGPATFNPDEHDGFKKICGLVGIIKVIHWGLIRELLDAMQAGTLEPEAAFLNASLIPDVFPVLSAAHKTLVAKSRESLATHTLHSELVFNYSGSKHISESFKRCGISENSTYVLVARFSASDDEPQP